MKITILDGYSVSEYDLSFDSLKEFGDVSFYPICKPEDIVETIGDSDAVFTNKCKLTEEIISQCPNLKFIGELATGYDNIDVEACRKHGVALYYTPGYSSDAVAQHAFALILAIASRIYEGNELVKDGKWFNKPGFDYAWVPSILLEGKSLGIVGYGNIGKNVAKIAEAFRMKVNIYSRDKEACMKSDIVSLHCPATEDNYHMVDEEFISNMKDGAILINTARGKLIDEAALKKALDSGKLLAAGLDVLETEPPAPDNPLLKTENCLVTPHVAWAPRETRQKVIDTAYDNLKCFIEGIETEKRLV